MALSRGGIVQFIRLMLDRRAARQLREDAKQAAREAAGAINSEIDKGSAQNKTLDRFVNRLTGAMDKAVDAIRRKLATGLIDENAANQQAERLRQIFDNRLSRGVRSIAGSMTARGAQTWERAQQWGSTAFQQNRATVMEGTKGLMATGILMGTSLLLGIKQELHKSIPHTMAELSKLWDAKDAFLKKGYQWGRDIISGTVSGIQANASAVKKGIGDALTAPSSVIANLKGIPNMIKGTFDEVRQMLNNSGAIWKGFQNLRTDPGSFLSPAVHKKLYKQAKGDVQEYEAAVRKAALAQLQFAAASNPVAKGILALHGPSTKLTSLLGGLAGGFGKLVAAMGITFGLHQVIRFLEQSIHAAAESSAAWARVSITFSDFGVALSSVAPRVKEVSDAVAELGYRPNEVAQIIGSLVQITGDVEASLKAVNNVIDLSVARFLSLETATKLVGRAMIGDIGSLQRHGIFLDKNINALDQLSQRFGGEALARSKSFEGAIKGLSSAYEQLQIDVGNAIAEYGGGNTVITAMIAGIKGLSRWFRENGEQIKILGDIIKHFVVLLGDLNDLFNWLNRLIQKTNLFFGTLGGVINAVVRALISEIPRGFGALTQGIGDLFGETTVGRWVKKAGDAVRRVGEEMRNRAKEALDATNKAFTEGLDNINKGLPAGGSKDRPMAPDYPLGTATHIQAREHMRLREQIRLLRQGVFSSNEAIASNALQELDKLEAKLQTMRAEAEQLVDEGKLSFQEVLEYTNELNMIEKIRLDLAKKAAAAEEQRAKFMKEQREISMLSKSAESDEGSRYVRALVRLNELQGKYADELARTNEESTRYLQLEQHLENIQETKNKFRERQQEKFDKEVELLGAMVDLDIDRENNITKLRNIHAQLTDELQLYKNNAKEVLRIRRDQLKVEEALTGGDLAIDNEIALLKEMMEVREMRDQAEKRATELQEKLNQKLNTGGLLLKDELKTRRQLAAIRELLSNEGEFRAMERQVNAAIKLSQSYKTRKEGVDELKRLEAELKTMMEDGTVKVEERARAILLLQRIEEAQRKLPRVRGLGGEWTPESLEKGKRFLETVKSGLEELASLRIDWDDILNFPQNFGEGILSQFKGLIDDLNETFWAELDTITVNIAEGFEAVFEDTFEKLFRDTSQLGDALGNLPKGLAAAVTAEIARMAKVKAIENFAWSLEELAKGIAAAAIGMPTAAAHFKASAAFAASALKWSLVAGAAQTLLPDSASGQKDREKGEQGDERDRGTATIIIKGGVLNTDDYEQMDALAKAMKVVGDRDIVIRRG